jgi:hypothetical protein
MSTLRLLSIATTARVPRPVVGSEALRRIWAAADERKCRSLLVVPTSDVDPAFDVAQCLAASREALDAAPAGLLDARGCSLSEASRLVLELSEQASHGRHVVGVVDPFPVSRVGIPLALASDAVLLCVTLEAARLDAVRQARGAVDPERVLGCVLMPAIPAQVRERNS